MVIFAAATGMRPGEWVALEHRDIDRAGRVAYVRRSFSKGRLTYPKTEASIRAVPLQARALAALDQLPQGDPTALLFPAERGGYLDLHNFRNRTWKPAQIALGIEPFRRVYDLRHTFATFALRAGISTFELSRYMGASLTMIDRHYGHLARDGREHAIRLLDQLNAPAVDVRGRSVDAGSRPRRRNRQRNRPLSRQ
jgi:integrase